MGSGQSAAAVAISCNSSVAAERRNVVRLLCLLVGYIVIAATFDVFVQLVTVATWLELSCCVLCHWWCGVERCLGGSLILMTQAVLIAGRILFESYLDFEKPHQQCHHVNLTTPRCSMSTDMLACH